jgi:tetratricopeptide (TPR) repeat protein
MKHCIRTGKIGLALLGLALVAGSQSLDPEELVRQGNTAFAGGDYEAAVALYQQAGTRTSDPGLVAFNEGTALYHLGRYREAVLRFRSCREDAEGARLTRLLYSLGNCLVQQARPSDTALFKEAAQLYEECIQRDGADPDLRAEARHNLELARLLLLKARAAKDRSDSESTNQEENNPPPPPDGNNVQPGNEGGPTSANATGRPETVQSGPDDPKAVAGQSDQPSPGKGPIPPLPDKDELVPLSPEDAAQHLRDATARIERERREYRQRPMPPLPAHVKDW